jgi:hypothetical protein
MQENFKLRILKSGAYCICTGSYQIGHLNFSELFTKNTLFEEKKIKSWNKWHFVEDNTEIMQPVLKMQ